MSKVAEGDFFMILRVERCLWRNKGHFWCKNGFNSFLQWI